MVEERVANKGRRFTLEKAEICKKVIIMSTAPASVHCRVAIHTGSEFRAIFLPSK